MQVANRTNVRMGEIAVAGAGDVLHTLLGSCVGVALYDRRNRIGGLIHAVLPHSRGTSNLPGKYVDTAIPEVLRLMEQAGGQARSLSARIAGGANMFNSQADDAVGNQNLAAAEELLASLGIPVVGRHCGGDQGRRVTFEVDRGRVFVEQAGMAGRSEI